MINRIPLYQYIFPGRLCVPVSPLRLSHYSLSTLLSSPFYPPPHPLPSPSPWPSAGAWLASVNAPRVPGIMLLSLPGKARACTPLPSVRRNSHDFAISHLDYWLYLPMFPKFDFKLLLFTSVYLCAFVLTYFTHINIHSLDTHTRLYIHTCAVYSIGVRV